MHNILEKIVDFFDTVTEYIVHGKLDQVIISASHEDCEFATGVQSMIINNGTSCRVIYADEIGISDETTIKIKPGTAALSYVFTGHLFRSPHMQTSTATFERNED